jgi:hypothetical protein
MRARARTVMVRRVGTTVGSYRGSLGAEGGKRRPKADPVSVGVGRKGWASDVLEEVAHTGRERGFGSGLYSWFNFGAGTKGLSLTWPEIAARAPPL